MGSAVATIIAAIIAAAGGVTSGVMSSQAAGAAGEEAKRLADIQREDQLGQAQTTQAQNLFFNTEQLKMAKQKSAYEQTVNTGELNRNRVMDITKNAFAIANADPAYKAQIIKLFGV